MKTPLRHQITEFDCGTISLTNCLIYLFEREDIPAELIKAISTYTLDCYDEFGNLGQKGTSKQAVAFLSRWMTDFCNSKNLGLKCEYLSGKDVTFEKIKSCLDKNGCVNLRSYFGVEHYVTVTGYDDEYVYIFDPYYSLEDEFKNDKYIEIDLNHPFSYNRKVRHKRFLEKTKNTFALGPVSKREAVLINRK